MELDSKLLTDLYEKATQAKLNSHSPYSKFRVGACILTNSGEYILGCNVENASYGLSICAERTAMCMMVSKGIKEFKYIGVVTDSNGKLIPPCGACRQFLLEFGRDILVVMFSSDGQRHMAKTVDELIPYSFVPEDLDGQN